VGAGRVDGGRRRGERVELGAPCSELLGLYRGVVADAEVHALTLAESREAPDHLVDALAAGARGVQLVDIGVEPGACGGEVGAGRGPRAGLGEPGHREGLAELAEHFFLGRLGRVQLEGEGAEPVPFEPAADDGERGHFLGDEQHPPAAGEVVGHDVGDRLALAGAGRAFEDEGAALPGRPHGDQLRRVGIAGAEQLAGGEFGVERRGLGEGPGLELAAAVEQVPHQALLTQAAGVLLQVVPHEELGEAEEPEVCALDDLPAAGVADRLAEPAEDERHIDAVLVLGQVLEAADIDAEVDAELLEEGDVRPQGLAGQLDAVAVGAAGRPAHEGDGEQDEGRPSGDLGPRRLAPVQHAQGEVEHIGPGLLDARPGRAVDLEELLGGLAEWIAIEAE